MAGLRGGGLNFGTVSRFALAAAMALPRIGWFMRHLPRRHLGFGQRRMGSDTPYARHNLLVNRTCCGSADRAVISFFARSALPQRAGYRHRYAAQIERLVAPPPVKTASRFGPHHDLEGRRACR